MGGMVFGPGALIAVGLYLVSMIGVGWIARTRRRSNSMADFYLAGRSMGLLVLFLTLYATQYSGNTLFGYTGTAYRIGFGWTASVLFMFSVIVGYMLFAPRLVTLARKEGFITPGDYITHRFRSSVLTLLSTILMIYALGNYALAQLKAMGAAVEGITDGAVPGSYGIIGLAVIMVIYETLGGMRSVAWTDMMQGGVLLLGFGILVFLIPQKLGGGLGHVVAQLSEMDPSKVQAPSLEGANKWISYVLLLGCGAAIYPQAIQRLYASRSVAVLKRLAGPDGFYAADYYFGGFGVRRDGRGGVARSESDQNRKRPSAGPALCAGDGRICAGLLAGGGDFCCGVGGADVHCGFGAVVDLVDVHQGHLPAVFPAAGHGGRVDEGGQDLLVGHRRRAGRGGDWHRCDFGAAAGAEVRGLDPGCAVLFSGTVLEAAVGADGAGGHGVRAGGGAGVDLWGQTDDLGFSRWGDWPRRQRGGLRHWCLL